MRDHFNFLPRWVIILLVCAIMALCANSAVAQTIWFVDGATTVSQPPTGEIGWTNPYKFIADVLNHVELADGDSIWVKGGPNDWTPLVYYPDQTAANPGGTGSVTATFHVAKTIRLLGGFAGTEIDEEDRGDWLAHPVWLSGDLDGDDAEYTWWPPTPSSLPALLADNVTHILTVRDTFGTVDIDFNNTLIDGFASIQGGYARMLDPDVADSEIGAGIFCDGVAPTVSNCRIQHCLAVGGDSPFRAGWGAGLFSDDGELRLRGCLFIHNQGDGGAGFYKAAGRIVVLATRIEDNHGVLPPPGTRGGGIRIEHEVEAVTFVNVQVVGNSSTGKGGGLQLSSPPDCFEFPCGAPMSCVACCDTYVAVFENVLFADNIAHGTWGGGAVLARSCRLTNCTVADNQALGSSGGGIYMEHAACITLHNSLAWGNASSEGGTLAQQIDGYGTLAAFASDLQGWPCVCGSTCPDGDGNRNCDPKFRDAPGGDYRLRTDSPCLDVGDNDPVPIDEFGIGGAPGTDHYTPDLRLHERVQGTGGGTSLIVDMGAHELGCHHDLNEDGSVDGLDLAILLADWTGTATYSPCGPPIHIADFNNDCKIEGVDLAELLAQWGGCDAGATPPGGESAAAGGGEEQAAQGGAEQEESSGDEQYELFLQWLLTGNWQAFLQWHQEQVGGG